MLASLLFFLQESTEAAGGHAEAVAEGAEKATHEPWLVEQANHFFGPVVASVENAIMPRLLGGHWTPVHAQEAIPAHVVYAVVVFLLCTAGLYLFRGRLSVDRPSRRQQLLELVVEQIRGLLDQVVGPYGRRYVPVVGAFAVFILVGNLMGLIPQFEAPTASINVTGALGITSFLYYITMGFRQQGIRYLKHFTGGLSGALLPTIGVLIFFVEIISNCVRPVTLSLRLFVNIFADHQIGAAFLSMTPWIIPIFTIVLGVFVSVVQTFIFIMLSMVYLSETVPHEEHDVEEHGHHEETAEAAAA